MCEIDGLRYDGAASLPSPRRVLRKWRSNDEVPECLGPALAVAILTAPPVVAQDGGTLKKVKETGSITLGFRELSVPFSYLDDKQQPVGFAMDICYKIVDAVKKELKLDKLEVKLNPVTSATRIPLMANGTIDLECGSTTNNVERQKQVWFTNTHFLTASRYVTKKASNINKIDDLKGKTIVSTSGTTNIKQATEANAAKNLGMTIMPAKDHAEAFLMVETDRAVAFVMDDILLASLVAGSKTPDGLQDFGRRVLAARALRDHAAQGRRRLQEGGRCRHVGALQEPGGRGDLRQVVHAADPAQGPQSECADERANEEAVRQSVRLA